MNAAPAASAAEQPADTPSAREVARQIRAWRRTRGDLSLLQVLEDAYVGVLSTVLVGAMLISVLLGVRESTAPLCTDACRAASGALGWIVIPALVAACLAVARLLGPVFTPPAAGPWLLATPVDRSGLLRAPWRRALALAAGAGLLVAPAAAILAGLDTGAGAAVTALAATGCLGAVAGAAWAQLSDTSWSRWATWATLALLWAALTVITVAPDRIPTPLLTPPQAWFATGVVSLLALATVVGSRRSLDSTRRSSLSRAEAAWPSLSGAMASLDLTLLYDVLLARRWAHAQVRPRRGGPHRWWALVHRDLIRLTRQPQPWLVLAALTLVPYAAARAGLDTGLGPVIALCGLIAGPALSTGLRVVCRSRALTTALPFSDEAVRCAHLVLPTIGLTLFACAVSPAVAAQSGWSAAWLVCLAGAASGLAASTRWICAGPPDYGSPLLATPAGGLPPGVVMGLVRGVDVWLLTAVPMLWGPTGVAISLALSATVMVALVAKTS